MNERLSTGVRRASTDVRRSHARIAGDGAVFVAVNCAASLGRECVICNCMIGGKKSRKQRSEVAERGSQTKRTEQAAKARRERDSQKVSKPSLHPSRTPIRKIRKAGGSGESGGRNPRALPDRMLGPQRSGLQMRLLDALVEQRIAAAAARGEFDDLPGAGAPLTLDDDALVPEEVRVANRILKNAGFVPPQWSSCARCVTCSPN